MFPHRWTVLDWLDGTDAWSSRTAMSEHLDALAVDLARAVSAIGDLTGLPAPRRAAGRRGGPIEPLVRTLERILGD